MSLDLSIFNFIHSLVGKMKVIDWLSIFFAEHATYLIIIAGVVFILWSGSVRKKINRIFVGALSLVLSLGIIAQLFYMFLDRARPFIELEFTPLFQEVNASFPSRHAIALFVIALLVASVNRKIGYWFFAFAILNGFARIYSGVHWPSDIIGGFVIATIGFYIVRALVPHQSRVDEIKIIPEEQPVEKKEEKINEL